MTENKIILITARGETAEKNHAGNLTVAPVFAAVAGFHVIGADSKFSIRASVPEGQLDEVRKIADEQGYITEKDYVLEVPPGGTGMPGITRAP